MRTRSQNHEYMQELERKRETAAVRPLPAKKRKTAHKPQSESQSTRHTEEVAVLMTPHHRPRAVQSHKTPTKASVKTAEGKRSGLRRSLPCSTPSTASIVETSAKITPVVLEKAAPVVPKEPPSSLPNDTPAVLQRVAAGQMLRSTAIVGRSAEHQAVRAVLAGDASSPHGSLFIIGPPGTGKSSSVDELLNQQGYALLRDEPTTAHQRRDSVGKSSKAAVKLNCSTFTSPEALYTEVAQQLQLAHAADATLPMQYDPYALGHFLSTLEAGSSPSQVRSRARQVTTTVVVVVLDEVDQLLRLPAHVQPQVKEVLRFLLRWAALVPSLFKFLGIMNGVDMYHQVSRVHLGDVADEIEAQVPRVIFASYAHEELQLILQSYVAGAQSLEAHVDAVIEPRAVELLARKVAARDGDARRAISLLQQCARHVLRRSGVTGHPKTTSSCAASSKPGITLRDVMQCAAAMLSSPVVQQIAQLPRQPKLLLFAITSLAPSSGHGNGTGSPRTAPRCDLNAVSAELTRLRAAPPTAWVPRFSRDELQTHLATLDCYALVKRSGRSMPSGRAFWTAKLSSGVTFAEVSRAMADDALLSQLAR